ncbi:phage tail terminator-like protein [Leisingera methylohalidivorans]|uniref:Tail terminator n=1 Tax=Leisingera methylohalidivorans DSM 14336 TaxID=999552 RepID=V9VYC6_9RHOB|nr:phage tail terminator-like protein [Leisingera methylohalidivorans]AHD02948.1 hypothetical protein METH_06870 [Leisingera methylohalidivorans DSM 14336]
MIRESDISDALAARLEEVVGIPAIIWENEDAEPNPEEEYIVVELVRLPPQDATLNGDGTVQRGFMQAAVLTELGQLARRGERLAENIAEHFPKALKLAVPGGKITINRPAFIGKGYRDGTHWRVPVHIHYQAS